MSLRIRLTKLEQELRRKGASIAERLQEARRKHAAGQLRRTPIAELESNPHPLAQRLVRARYRVGDV